MKIVNFNDFNIIETALEYLNNNNIVIAPTETVYGLMAIPNITAVNKIFEIKKRDLSKPIGILTSDTDLIFANAILNNEQIDFIKKEIIHGTTFIIKYNNKSIWKEYEYLGVDLMQNGENIKQIGIRIPQNDFILTLLNKLNNKIILATSVNITSMNAATKITEIDYEIANQVELIIKGDEKQMKGQASKIFNLTQDSIDRIR